MWAWPGPKRPAIWAWPDLDSCPVGGAFTGVWAVPEKMGWSRATRTPGWLGGTRTRTWFPGARPRAVLSGDSISHVSSAREIPEPVCSFFEKNKGFQVDEVRQSHLPFFFSLQFCKFLASSCFKKERQNHKPVHWRWGALQRVWRGGAVHFILYSKCLQERCHSL